MFFVSSVLYIKGFHKYMFCQTVCLKLAQPTHPRLKVFHSVINPHLAYTMYGGKCKKDKNSCNHIALIVELRTHLSDNINNMCKKGYLFISMANMEGNAVSDPCDRHPAVGQQQSTLSPKCHIVFADTAPVSPLYAGIKHDCLPVQCLNSPTICQ